jgi:sensor histidine kinase regulating citrate/malate metabolism
MVQVSNSVNGTVVNSDGQFITSANDDRHGYGLKTIQAIANKYHGYFICEQDGNEVVCTVFIPFE